MAGGKQPRKPRKTKKRPRGEGHIERLPSGSYRVELPGVKDPLTGKLHREKKTFKPGDYDAAVAWKTERLAARRRGELVRDTKLTVGQWLADWLELHRTKTEPNTFNADRSVVNVHLIPRIGHLKLSDLSPVVVEKFLAKMHADGLSQSVRHKAGKVLRNALNRAVTARLLAVSPMAGVTIPGRPDPQTHSLTADDLRKLIETADGMSPAYLGACVRLWADCGLRPAELFGLQWQDWNPETREISVRRSVCKTSGKLKEPKTRRSRRTLPVSAATAAAVEKVRTVRTREPADPIFPAPEGGHWWHSNFNDHVFDPMRAKAGLKLTPYTMRHTMATLLLQAGVSVKVVSERLGHEDVVTTLRSYAHVLPGMQKGAADTMGGIITGGVTTPESDG